MTLRRKMNCFTIYALLVVAFDRLLVLGTLLDSWGGADLSLEKHFFSSCGLSLNDYVLLSPFCSFGICIYIWFTFGAVQAKKQNPMTILFPHCRQSQGGGNPLLESSLANRVLSEESLDSLNANVKDHIFNALIFTQILKQNLSLHIIHLIDIK
ncbi:hypothetical protein T09_768 [Trichinella sp. T9]|nr:hypothetical protein T09_768 [Trichinella sp. T9]